jgi:RNA polymerase sigma-70 factor (ECF subfamily)
VRLARRQEFCGSVVAALCRSTIARLDHVDRSLTLLLLDGFSYREMAETLGISESYVGVKINRIKSHLRSLTKEGGTNGV